MGLRFRKSVKICKGFKINFSKSGASLSLGGRGHSVNLGGKGLRITAGIPGTGLSYSAKFGGGSKSHKSHRSSHHSAPKKTTVRTMQVQKVSQVPHMPLNVILRMDENGKIDILDQNQNIITDQTVIRHIKQSQSYMLQKQQMETQRQAHIAEIVRASQEENERFINIHTLSPIVEPKENYEYRLSSLQPNRYVPEPYSVPMPEEQKIRYFLMEEAKRNISGSPFTIGRLREQYVNERIQERFYNAMNQWEINRNNYYREEEKKRIEAEQYYQVEFENQKLFMKNLIDGEMEAVSEVFDSWIEDCQMPVEMNINYEWIPDCKIMMLDVDLPEIEDIPEMKKIQTDSGNLKEKKKTQSEIREEYARLVFGLAMFLVSNTFNFSPAIQNVVMSGYTKRRDKDGNLNDDYIYSIKFPREMYEGKNVAVVIDPIAFCMRAENRCNMTTTSLFKSIKPFDYGE